MRWVDGSAGHVYCIGGNKHGVSEHHCPPTHLQYFRAKYGYAGIGRRNFILSHGTIDFEIIV